MYRRTPTQHEREYFNALLRDTHVSTLALGYIVLKNMLAGLGLVSAIVALGYVWGSYL